MVRKGKFLITLSLIFGIFSFVSTNHNDTQVAVAAVDATKESTYYSSLYDVSGNLKYTGDELLSKLNTIISTDTTNGSYSKLGEVYKTSDVSSSSANKVVLYYTGEERTWDFSTYANYNIDREHVWCRSHFGTSSSNTGDEQTTPESDAHQIRPCDASLNRARSNYYYEELSSTTYDKYGNIISGGLFCPSDAYKGDVARICFYVATRYKNLSFVDGATTGQTGTNYKMGNISALLKWNILYGVNSSEIKRNNAVAKVQNNRNPFIDHPEYAVYIWKDFNATTKNIVDEYTYDITFNTNGGSSIDAQEVLYNYTVNKPTNPSKSGYTFEGWYTNASLTNVFDFSTKITEDKTLYAKWSSNESSSGGSGSTTTPMEGITIDLTSQGFNNAEVISTISDSNNEVNITFDKGNGNTTPKYFNDGQAVRTYAKNTITISAEKAIKSIEFYFGGSDGTNEITVNNGIFTSPIWTSSNTSTKEVIFTIGGNTGNRRIAGITIQLYEHNEEDSNLEPIPIETSIAELVSNKPVSYTNSQIFEVIGIWSLSSYSTATTYGNGYLSDENGNSIHLYGLSSSKDKSITWNSVEGTYSYRNSLDYTSLGLSDGDKIKVGLIYAGLNYDNYYAYYIGQSDETATDLSDQIILTSLSFSYRQVESTIAETKEFKGVHTGNSNYTDKNGCSYSNSTVLSSDLSSFGVKSAEKAYKAYETANSSNHIIKIATSSVGGSVTLLNSSYNAHTITFKASGWSAGTVIELTNAKYKGASNITLTTTYSEYTVDVISDSSDVTIRSSSNGSEFRFFFGDVKFIIGEESTSYVFNNFLMRYKTTINTKLFESFDGVEFGALINVAANNPVYEDTTVAHFNSIYLNNNYLNIKIDESQIIKGNDGYTLSAALTGIPVDELKTELVTAFYIKTNTNVYFTSSKKYSVSALVDTYLNGYSSILTEEEISMLKLFDAYIG